MKPKYFYVYLDQRIEPSNVDRLSREGPKRLYDLEK